MPGWLLSQPENTSTDAAATLEAAAHLAQRATIWAAADQAVADGRTTAAEIERVLGPR